MVTKLALDKKFENNFDLKKFESIFELVFQIYILFFEPLYFKFSIQVWASLFAIRPAILDCEYWIRR